MGNHLYQRVEVSEVVRDRLRTELGCTAYGATMLDGVSRAAHESAVINNAYFVEPAQVAEKFQTQPETLFDLAPAH